ncbi:nucleotidyltransferase family protein [Exiguobacterium acetylicum]|uniref:nucleotidyltransferase domain-containing protein n=1 Tax=Exiguobacterium acetylicum TaxID=41170 RepID=UPI003876118D
MNSMKMLSTILVNDETHKKKFSESVIQFFIYHRVIQCIHINSVESEQLRDQITQKKKTMFIELLRYTNELIRVLALFQINEVNIICLKGPVIGQKIYHSIGLRMFRDLDLLIDVKNLPKGTLLLEKLGYVLDEESEYDARRANHLVFTHTKTNHIIELHWRLHPNIINEPTFEELWTNHETVRIAGADVPCLETTELFVYLISHGSKHAWFRLRWLYDIHLFLEQPLDLVEIQTRLEKRGYLHMMGQALLLRQELFEEEIPESFVHLTKNRKSKRMAKMALRIIEEQNDPGKMNQTISEYWYWKRYFWLIRDSSKRFEFVWHHLIPNQQDRAMIPLPKSLRFLYIPLRPLTWSLRRWKGRTSS